MDIDDTRKPPFHSRSVLGNNRIAKLLVLKVYIEGMEAWITIILLQIAAFIVVG